MSPPSSSTAFAPFRKKMEAVGLSEYAITAFAHNYRALEGNGSGCIDEASIRPARNLPRLEKIKEDGSSEADEGNRARLLEETVVIKLNGGLGTGMGLRKAKSLLRIHGDLAFLDLIAKQILYQRKLYGMPLRFLLMNSYATCEDTVAHMKRYPALGGRGDFELMQNRVPKVDAATRAPSNFPQNPELEWCPPGHGDIYPSLAGSGWLDRLLREGVRYAFVSNSDNLGATLDLDLLGYFAQSGSSFLMEVTPRTAIDRKGGHLAVAGDRGTLLLRESAQCAREDRPAFEDIKRHRYFNTNNLWIRLDRLRDALESGNGVLPLSVIKNEKTVDPRDKTSAKVYQLETAMGAAIECFEDAAALVVPRARFAPVKTTDDLLMLRSDAFHQTEDHRLVLIDARNGQPPDVILDPEHYKLVDQLEVATANGVPSLRNCHRLEINGPVRFDAGVVVGGSVVFENKNGVPKTIGAGGYRDTEVSL